MAQAKNGDTVKVHYTGKLGNGAVFDSSLNREPLQFTLGNGQLIQGFEQAVISMSIGDSKTITIPSDKAYGPHYEEMVMLVDRNQLPDGLEPKVGQQLQMSRDDGQTATVTVTDVSELNVKLDANHPLAGKDLTFDIQLVEVV